MPILYTDFSPKSCNVFHQQTYIFQEQQKQKMAGDRIAALFLGCINPEPEPTRPRIDRSMIGNPSNFVHTAHVGATEVSTGSCAGIQSQMGSKGGIDTSTNLHIPHIQNATPITAPQISAN